MSVADRNGSHESARGHVTGQALYFASFTRFYKVARRRMDDISTVAAAIERAQAALDRTIAPISDHRGSAEYRREVAKSLIEKFWWETQEAAA